ncbi:hypothetical protein LBMAG16_09080 [Actinomycetes bacterium]|nr:hypothetical protein LBMAG16_09080 [Actinomycetes bacterium]
MTPVVGVVLTDFGRTVVEKIGETVVATTGEIVVMDVLVLISVDLAASEVVAVIELATDTSVFSVTLAQPLIKNVTINGTASFISANSTNPKLTSRLRWL